MPEKKDNKEVLDYASLSDSELLATMKAIMQARGMKAVIKEKAKNEAAERAEKARQEILAKINKMTAEIKKGLAGIEIKDGTRIILEFSRSEILATVGKANLGKKSKRSKDLTKERFFEIRKMKPTEKDLDSGKVTTKELVQFCFVDNGSQPTFNEILKRFPFLREGQIKGQHKMAVDNEFLKNYKA